jgi:hypothetical protein
MNAIPTHYTGVNFRSRLEARWAAFFELIKWRVSYEPLDLNGYIPDFISTETLHGRVWLFEIKPICTTNVSDFISQTLETVTKIKMSGWAGPFCICGALGQLVFFEPDLVHGPVQCVEDTCDNWRTAWREAGNRVQWRAVAPK